MVSLLALIFVLLILVKMILFVLFPQEVFTITEKFMDFVSQYGFLFQGALMLITIAIGAILAMTIGFFTMIAAGWFWSCIYTIFLIPMTYEAVKKDELKSLIFSPEVKNQFLSACVFMICLCILTIGLFL
tara:strand:- start:125 stop:514 length:390 start_codon:yes stop_codon:yes gene_type:complete